MMNSIEKRKAIRKNSLKKSFIRRLEQRNPLNLGFNSQSAMEYLMTYGWAILIIAVVLGALFSLGVFNSSSFAPKAQPGSCQVFRPDGPGSNFDVNLMGVCNGELPQYVAQFNGQNAYINLGNSPTLSPEAGNNGQMTLCLWYYINSLANYHGPLIKGESAPSSGNAWEYTLDQYGSPQGFTLWTGQGSNIAYASTGATAAPKTWYFSCFTYNYASSSAYYYLDGVPYSATFTSGTPATQGTGKLIIGAGENGYSNVELANVQIYNTSLSANEIQALYLEGIGGAPIDLQNLVGWWPLNGNANDYSGNGNNGQAYSVTYTSNWESGYTPP